MPWDANHARRYGATLRRLRQERGLSQEALAYRAGITRNQLQLIENGRASSRKDSDTPSNPRASTFTGLAEVLGVTVSEMFTDADL